MEERGRAGQESLEIQQNRELSGPPSDEAKPGSSDPFAGRNGPWHEEETLRDALRPAGPVRLEMDEVHQPGAVWLRIQGELDVLTVPRLGAQLDTLVRRSTEDVVVDLRGTKFIDSAGVQMLLSTQRRLEKVSRRLTVVCDEGPVRTVLELTRLAEPLGLIWGHEIPSG